MPDRGLERAAESADNVDHRAQMRRISYFMLFRLGMLAVFTVVAGAVVVAGDPGLGTEPSYVWGALVTGYLLTIVYARMLPRVRSPGRFACLQTVLDVAMSAFVVQITGGVESGLASLYLISVLGAATMGGKRLTWATAAACAGLYLTFSTLELTGVLQPLTFTTPEYEPPPVRESIAIVVRTLAALTGVALLSSFLNTQLQTSVSQVGNLRALNENIVRSLTSGLITTDRDHRLLYFNPAAREILALEDSDIGRRLDEVLPGLPLAPRPRSGRIDLRHRRPDGRQIHVGLSRTPLRDVQGTAVGHVVHFQDVTRLHELSERVRRGERLAALGGMAASVAHEIRNPLAAISGSAELLASAALEDEDRRLLAIIHRESTRLSDMVRDLLAFTRPREPVAVRVDLHASVRATAESFAADPANAEITMVFDGAPGVEVDVDPSQLGQVLWNLMRNAAEAQDGRGKLRVAVSAEANEACIEVSDDGKGIEPDRLEHVFDPFFTTKEHGTGFGLAIVHRIVHDNGGTIRVKSTPGVGSTFTIVFPRAPGDLELSDSGELSLDD